MGKTSYQTLEQLTQSISNKVNQLNTGGLGSSEIETLTQDVRDLYERLIVIRHKAYEKFGEPTQVEATPVVKEKVESPENDMFDFTEDTKAPVVESDMMSFDFSETITEVPVEVEPQTTEELEAPTPTPQPEKKPLNESITTSSSSLNDAFKSSHSLADKLNQTKINDLKTSIDINKKFNFITNLFAGSNEDYNEAINALNGCADSDEARTILGDVAQKHNWDVENDTVVTFVDLVERRYL